MSCDYSVWNSKKRITPQEANEVHQRLCEDDLSDVEPSPKVSAFYAELTARFPEIDAVHNDDYLCPWSCTLDRSEAHVIMPCLWSTANTVGDFVKSLAKKHGLTFYDPQSDKLIFPDGDEATSSRPWWKFW